MNANGQRQLCKEMSFEFVGDAVRVLSSLVMEWKHLGILLTFRYPKLQTRGVAFSD